ncbi:MAG: unnamed protein product [uncultured Paraburkholderia sp.]|nr:MAG: unnamed protein product [uncultured Paraburkholderia sp.]
MYLYFCTDDTVVGLDNIRGIGTYGMPNSVTAVALGSTASAWAKFVQLAAMDAFRKAPGRFAFYQRLWTKLKRDGKPVLVGLAPQTVTARTPNEPRFPGGLEYVGGSGDTAPLPHSLVEFSRGRKS